MMMGSHLVPFSSTCVTIKICSISSLVSKDTIQYDIAYVHCHGNSFLKKHKMKIHVCIVFFVTGLMQGSNNVSYLVLRLACLKREWYGQIYRKGRTVS